MENNKQITIFLAAITLLCLLNFCATAYLIKTNVEKNTEPKTGVAEAKKEYEELDKKLDKFFDKQDQEMKKLFEEK